MFTEGQEVWIHEGFGRHVREPWRAPVEKVGRKYATVKLYNRPHQFDKETGHGAKEDQRSWIESDEMRAERLEREAATEYLARYGLHKFETHIKYEDFYKLADFLKGLGYE